MATCNLCGEDKILRNSHVFPELLYHSIYDERHRAIAISPVSADKHRTVQQGLRERLFCDACEGRFQKVESYAASVLRRLPDTTYRRPGTLALVPNVEYRQFKLFQLSLIWRASVARQPSFHEVDLGPHEPVLRTMLLGDEPGEPLDYPCLLVRPAKADSLRQFVKFPGESRMMGHRMYHMIAAGLVWFFFVSSHTRTILEHRSFLSRSNELPINLASGTADQLIRGIARNLHALGVI